VAGAAVAGAATAAAGGRAAAAPAVTEIIIPDLITVRELAEKMHRSAIDVIKALMNYGIMVPITQTIDFDTAQVVGEDLGITVKRDAPPEPEVVEVVEETPKTLRQQIIASERPEELVVRPPVVTVLGHVDHGKTTLLDAIRETRVVDGEAGGITQHIGAYQVERQGRKITFLDTPGHEAFTAMRARGAMVTDMAVLVVAADDGVMPQTKEAIAHVRAAKVPIIVALNKIDKPNANPDRVKQELADNGLLIEEYGGDVICVPVSAKFRRGIDDLLENILLVADIDPLKANPQGNCVGTVIESRLDKSRGPLATLLVQNGTLRVSDSIVAGDIYGKMRALYDDKGQPISEALPATPVVVLGMSDVAAAGDTFSVQADERTARALAAERQAQKRADTTAATAPKAVALESIFAQAQAGQVKELNLILKADVQGSVEPIVNSLEKLGDDKLHVKILHQAIGNINESDVMLAVASRAIILGFNVTADAASQRMAEQEGVDVRTYSVIYNIIEDVEKALKGMLEPVYKDVVLGHAEVRAVFHISKVGRVAGCYITDGEIQRGASVRVKRNGAVVKEDRIGTLKRFQEDATEVKTGFECGLSLNNFNELEVGDILEAYKKERVS
jgi:translation initiation factor IF-2